jgi:putative ABC transport system permease protein
MTPLDRKLARDLLAAKGRLLAIISIIAVGVMCFIYMRSSYYNLKTAQSSYYAQCRMADFWVDLKKIPIAELDALAELPGVAEIQPRIQFYVTVDLPRVEEPLNGLVISVPQQRDGILNNIVMRRGGNFTDRRRNEVIVSDAFAQAHGLYPGQWIHVLLNNRRQELFIVGTAISSEFVYLLAPGRIVPDDKRFGVFYLKHEYAEEAFDFDGAANSVVGRFTAEYQQHPDEVLRRAESVLEPYGVFGTTKRKDQASNRFLSDEIAGLGTFSMIMPVIFLGVAALVLNVLLSRQIDQQRTTIGTLKALGYGDRQIVWHYIKFALAIGAAGSILGSVCGYGMAVWVTSIYAQFYEFPRLANEFYPGTYAIGFVISLVCALVGSLHGARATLRLQPAEAMRPKPPRRGGKVWLERATRLWASLSFGWRMVLRGVIRNPVRTGVGVFASAMGAALLMCGLMMSAATHYLVDFQYTMVTRSDIDLSLEGERGRDALLEIRRLPGVDRAEPQLAVSCTFIHGPHRRRGGITGLAPDARLTIPRDPQGNPIRVPTTGLAMSRKLATLLDVSVGDQIIVRPTKGLRREVEAPVVALTDGYLGLGVYADIHYLSHLIGEEFAVTGVQLTADPRPEVRTELNRRLKQLPALRAVNAREDVIRNLQEELLDLQNVFIGLVMMFAGVIFFGSILNASLVNLTERTREIATLRVLGYGPWQIGGLFLKESMLVNLLGTLVGLPLGYSLAWLISTLYNTEMFRFPLVSPPSVWVITIAIAVGFAGLAHLVVQRVIFRLDYLEALNVKE